MTTTKRMLLITLASWILPITAGGVFSPQSRGDLQSAVRVCQPADTAGKRDPTLAGLDIYIQYCGGWGYGRRSRQLKSKLEAAFDGQISVREVRDPVRTGNFEVFVNGENVWSKKNGQDFPDTQKNVETIIAAIRTKQNAVRLSATTARIKTNIADIHIQYCGGWGYGPKSRQLKSKLEAAFDGQISVRETKDPGVTGNFEVFVNGDLVWSMRTWGQQFPTTKAEVDTICDEIRDRQSGRA